MAPVQGVLVHWMLVVCVVPRCLSEAATSRTYYDTLNVEPTATGSQIKKAFRELAIKYHPDKNKSADAEKTFREIAEAYTVLSNKDKRRRYDKLGHSAFTKGEDGTANDDFWPGHQDEHGDGFHFNFADFFQDFEDGGPFAEEPQHFQWPWDQDGEDEYEHGEQYYTFRESDGFSFRFGDGEENEDELYHHNFY